MSSKVIAVDVGGTFTDVVAVTDGVVTTAKVATNTASSDVSVLEGARQLGVDEAVAFNLASTAGLNSVLTRRLPKVALLTTFGHRDVLDRGSIVRPIEAINDPSWRRNFGDAGGRPLVPRYLRRGVKERVLASGEILVDLDEDHVREQLAVLRKCEVQGVAICLLHAYKNATHEKRLRELVAEELGSIPCSLSSEVSPLVREYPRASTTVIDALMKLIYGDYTKRVVDGLAGSGFEGEFNYADCSAKLLPYEYAMQRPYQLLFGGPAGGAVSAAHLGELLGDRNLLCADVGGTSVDISVIVDGEPWSASTFEIEHDMVVSATSTKIVTLGAGGGSIIAATPEGDIQTGPDSAGAQPGPACYDTGGSRPTVTDAALLMGILSPGGFVGGRKKLRPDLAMQAFESMDTKLSVHQRIQYGWRMAINHIAEGLLNISIGRGIDPREFSLVACGAAGPMLIPFVLDQYPVRRVIVPPHPGLFSALGLASSDRVYSDHRGEYRVLDPSAAEYLDSTYTSMEEGLLGKIGGDHSEVRVRRTFDARFVGQSWDTPLIEVPPGVIDEDAIATMIANFRTTYGRLNGNNFDHMPVEAVTYRVELVLPGSEVSYAELPDGTGAEPSGEVLLRYLGDEPILAPEYQRTALGAGDVVTGPAVIREEMSTTFVPAGRTATVGRRGEMIVE